MWPHTLSVIISGGKQSRNFLLLMIGAHTRHEGFSQAGSVSSAEARAFLKTGRPNWPSCGLSAWRDQRLTPHDNTHNVEEKNLERRGRGRIEALSRNISTLTEENPVPRLRFKPSTSTPPEYKSEALVLPHAFCLLVMFRSFVKKKQF
jgi:hypothetical protein